MLERTKGEGVRRRPTVQGLRRRGAAERRKWSGSFENGPQFFKRARAFVRISVVMGCFAVAKAARQDYLW